MINNEELKQIENREFIESKLGCGIWVTVFEQKKSNNRSLTYWCGLISNNKVEEILRKYTWDIRIGTRMPGCTETWNKGNREVLYSRLGGAEDGLEPFIFYRDFDHKGKYVEVIEEFRLLFNLYHDKKTDTYLFFDDCLEEDPVIKISNEKVEVKLKYLKQFLGIKEMHLAIYFEMDSYFDETIENRLIKEGEVDYSGSLTKYNLHFQNLQWGKDKKSLSRLMGKKLIAGYEKGTCGIWPFEEVKEFEDYIIGVDENGKNIRFCCDPKGLANNFGANPDSPDYLTPVFFKREVLQKYYSNPEIFKVEDGFIHCSDRWGLRLDNHNKDYINVYLGDLGTDLPFKEQQYFKCFNIIPDGTISEVKFKRDFLAQFTEAKVPDIKFKSEYVQTNEIWDTKYGWNIFLELNENDKHNFETIRIPISNDQAEFDGLVLSLVKVMIDSLNEAEISKRLIDKSGNLKGIGKLERFLCESGFLNYDEHIKYLRNLQDLRSRGTGHRKGSSYEKSAKVFEIDIKELKEVYIDILEQAIDFLAFLKDNS
nr:hypothetical protein [uncultured Acetobacterium sp.]